MVGVSQGTGRADEAAWGDPGAGQVGARAAWGELGGLGRRGRGRAGQPKPCASCVHASRSLRRRPFGVWSGGRVCHGCLFLGGWLVVLVRPADSGAGTE